MPADQAAVFISNLTGKPMREISGMKRLLTFISAALLSAVLLCSAAAADQDTRIDLKLNDSTVLIYKAKTAGYREGQKLNVYRDGKLIGSVEITKIMPAYAQANILSGSDKIHELDSVLPEGSAPTSATGLPNVTSTVPAPSSAGGSVSTSAPTSASASSGAAATTAPASAGGSSGRSRRGDSSASSADTSTPAATTTPAPAAGGDAAPAGGSRRSRRGGSSSSGDAAASTDTTAAPAADTAAPSGGSSRRRGASSSSSASTDTSGGDTTAAASTETPAATQTASALSKKPAYVFHAGYFYLKSDVPGTVINHKPALMFGVDYLAPKKKHKLLYSVMYTKPVIKFHANNQDMRSQFKIIQFSAGYIFDNSSSKMKAPDKLYYGLSVGYRTASSQNFCEISCNGTTQFEKKSLDGFDYHGILGYHINKDFEFKFDYSIDEQYYSMDLGYNFQ